MLEIVKMTETDLDLVACIEKESFTLPWSRALFEKDIKENKAAHFYTLKENAEIVGYGGFWLLQDEINIVNLAIKPELRKKGLGRFLVKALLAEGLRLGAKLATLEVREGNTAARALYESLGFKEIAVRKKYYSDNGENAVVMWLNPVSIKAKSGST